MNQEQRKITPEVERRYAADGMEIRQTDGGKATLRGYAARFGSVYSMGWYTEEVHRDAFRNADMSDVRILFNHDPNQILGRTKAGTARVGVDSEGLWYEVDLPESATGIRESVARGDIDQSSWGFMLRVSKESSGDKWERRDGKDHRTLTDVSTVFDASPVTFPANPDTSVAKRSFDAYSEQQAPEVDDTNEFELLDLDLSLMEMEIELHKTNT